MTYLAIVKLLGELRRRGGLNLPCACLGVFLSVSNLFAQGIQGPAARNQAMERQMSELNSAQELRSRAMDSQINRLVSARERLMDESIYKAAQRGKERFFFIVSRIEAFKRQGQRRFLPA